MNESLQGRFREVIHNNYTLYYFVYMYTQICDEDNVHKSTAAMNYFFSNMTNTVIFMTLGDLRIHHTMAVPLSPLHIRIRILVVYVVKISRGRWPELLSGKTSDECIFRNNSWQP
jgi:hypothetical protein